MYLLKNLTDFGFVDARLIRVTLSVSWHQDGWAWDTDFLMKYYPHYPKNLRESKATTEEFTEFLAKMVALYPNVRFSVKVKPISERNCLEEVVSIIRSVRGHVS